MSGAVFVLEELLQKLEVRSAITALGSSAAAIFVARFFLGNHPDFNSSPLAFPTYAAQPFFILLGAIAGLLAVGYNRAILGALDAAARANFLPVELRAALIGGSVGVTAWFAPDLVGGGDALAQRMLDGAEPLVFIPLALVFRVALGAASYAAGTPGGLFAPLLAVGAQLGSIFGILVKRLFPDIDIQPESFVIIGMAALFAGMVRSPLTGIILIMEMTANTTLLQPMLSASFAAMIAPMLLGDAPIYEALRGRSLESAQSRPHRWKNGDTLRRDRSS